MNKEINLDFKGSIILWYWEIENNSSINLREDWLNYAGVFEINHPKNMRNSLLLNNWTFINFNNNNFLEKIKLIFKIIKYIFSKKYQQKWKIINWRIQDWCYDIDIDWQNYNNYN